MSEEGMKTLLDEIVQLIDTGRILAPAPLAPTGHEPKRSRVPVLWRSGKHAK